LLFGISCIPVPKNYIALIVIKQFNADGKRLAVKGVSAHIMVAYAAPAFALAVVGIPVTLILYYVKYVLESPNADAFLLLYFATGIVFLPVWVRLARRIGNKAAWLSAMVINMGAFAGVFLLGAGDEFMYGMLVFLSGIGFGTTLALPSAIQADVIDYDELLTGCEERVPISECGPY
jgi:GPH family glycoside/pentoside/hexuronide:cation symporter